MWLFDDILKKPEHTGAQTDPLSGVSGGTATTGGTSSVQPPQDDATIIIQKSSEETVFGAETESQAIDAMNAPAVSPVIHAEEDTSSILVSAPTQITESAALTPSNTVAEMMPTPVAPIESPVIDVIPAAVENVATQAPTPLTEMFEHTPAPTPAAVPEVAAIATPAPITSNSGSIFDSIMAAETTPAPIVEAPAPVTWNIETPITPAPMNEVITSTHNFSTPREFIEKSLANIDVMLGNIDTRHAAKETEELGYKMEKLRYTELEKTAHTEKLIMDKEREHAMHMRKILETELKKDEENKKQVTSVESTLEDIGAKHPVHKHHKTEHVDA